MKRKLKAAAVSIALALGGTVAMSAPAFATTGSDPNRPASWATGYTSCWNAFPALSTTLDPYDSRTWPSDTTCSPSTQTNIKSHLIVVSNNTSTGQSITSTFDKNDDGTTSMTGDAARWPSGGFGPADAALSATPGQSISVSYSLTMTFPQADNRGVISNDGMLGTRSGYTIEMRTGAAPTAGPNADANALPITRSCNDSDYPDVVGKTITINCTSFSIVPADFSFNQWGQGASELSLIKMFYMPELRWVYPDLGGPGAWLTPVGIDGTVGSTTSFRIDPAPAWAPVGEAKSFRVRSADTLTVSETGLLDGAAWAQGGPETLSARITDLPTGGTITDGDMQFTSEQLGDHPFAFVLTDPVTGIESQPTAGLIEVYADPAVGPWSCFSGPVTPNGQSYSDIPGVPERFIGTVALGSTFHFKSADLLAGSTWSTAGLVEWRDLGNLDDVNAEPGDLAAWTPRAAGIYTFQYMGGAKHCASRWFIGTIEVASEAALPSVDSPVVVDPVVVDPAVAVQVQPATVLAQTGSDSGDVFSLAITLMIGGAGVFLFGRRSRVAGVQRNGKATASH